MVKHESKTTFLCMIYTFKTLSPTLVFFVAKIGVAELHYAAPALIYGRERENGSGFDPNPLAYKIRVRFA
jgi:hypothetical protein